MAAPQVEDRVRRRVVLGSRTRDDALAHLGCDERPQRRQRQQPVGQRGPARRGLGVDQAQCGALEVRGRRQRVGQADRECLLGLDAAPRQHQLQCLARADQAWRSHRAAEARMDAQLHFRQPQRRLAVIGHDAVAARERELEPATERETVDQRDGRTPQRLDRTDDLLAGTHQLVALVGRLELGELLDVGTGDEAVGLAGVDHQAAGCAPRDVPELDVQFLEDRPGQRVGRGVGAVELEPGDVGRVDLQRPVGCRCGGFARHGRLLRNRCAGTQAASATRAARTVKSHTSGRWSEYFTAGTLKPVTSMPSP